MSTRFRLEDLPPAMREQVRQELGHVPRETPTSKRPKYGNQVIDAEDDTFGSKWELKRFRELQEQERAGLIDDLRHHVTFPLHVMTPTGDRVRIGAYEADEVYRRGEDLVIEDTKSEATRKHPLYRWKASHFEAEYGLKILDVVRVRRKRRDREVHCE